MRFDIEYFHERVLAEIESWPVDVLADYARLVELPGEHGLAMKGSVMNMRAIDSIALPAGKTVECTLDVKAEVRVPDGGAARR